MLSRKYASGAVISFAIAMLAIGVFTSVSLRTAAFATSDSPCPHGTSGSGNPHDTENPQNPHDTQLGDKTGNPHDACRGS